MKKILFLLCLPFSLLGQNTIGFPEVVNYSKQSYGAGLQNWDIKQDKNGIIYFANNEGLLSFDGSYWNLYPLPNKTIVRSIEIGFDNNIYVGGQDEIGYFSPSPNGRLQYHSLTGLLSAKEKSFGDIWDIVKQGESIYFRCNNFIFQYSGGNLVAAKAPTAWVFLGSSNNRVYAQDLKSGLLVLSNQLWQPVAANNQLPVNDFITGIHIFHKTLFLIATLKSGLFTLTQTGIKAFDNPNNSLFSETRIYASSKIDEDRLALATSNKGIYIIDTTGSVIQSFSTNEQLQNNNVLSIYADKHMNLWLGLDNGIDFIAYNSAIKHIKPMMEEASGYAMLIHDQTIYAGTSAGLYRVPLQQIEDLSFSKGSFSMVNNTKGQVWNLAAINNSVLLGHHEGAFLIKQNNAVQISTEPGFWNFIPLSSVYPAVSIAAGHYEGIRYFNYDGKDFVPDGATTGFKESSRFIAIDKNGQQWVSHPYHGVYRLQNNSDGTTTVITYTDKQGLPSALNNHAYKIKNELVVATEKGVYSYNASKDLFVPSSFYTNLLGDQSIRYLKEDTEGNVWFIHEKVLGVIDVTETKPRVIYLPELTTKMLSGFELIYPLDEKNIFMGGEKGFYHINYEKYKRTLPSLSVQVRKVIITQQKDSVLFGGYFTTVNDSQFQQKEQVRSLSYKWKTIQFEYSSPLFGYQSNLEYSYRLVGFTDAWSDWSTRTEKEYTNLSAGTYTFEVKVRNNLGNESPAATYTFQILPPWYETWWAKTIYVLLLLGAFYLFYRWQLKKFNEQEQKFEEEQRKLKYIHELERSKTESELVTLRNEKLEAEINYKNSEVASSAMHLVKKGELLTKIKGDLTQMMKRIDNEQAIGEIKKMIKSLSEEEHMDEEWENFTKHFDKVNSDFVMRLKQVHPNLTGNELKLCTYLRMNLSTKEIAQLMNISVRGVEISRYRLRKKLSIGSEVNLFDYLLTLNS
jgi:ligand-binding sensor domain-containing protein/DNA-binding CsgD family transcriptional regulator